MIIDASVAFKWLVEEPGSAEAVALIGRGELSAPTLMHAEVANALWKRVARGELLGEGAPEQLEKLAALVRTVDESALLGRAVELALELGPPVYDCIYLALAEAEGDVLVTADQRFLGKLAGTSYEALVQALGS